MSASEPRTSLSQRERRLLQLMQEIHYGRIEGLVISDGEPVIESSTIVFRDVKFGPNSSKKPVLVDHNYLDKPQIASMLQQFHALGDSVVEFLDIHDGLPFRMRVMESVLL